MKKLCHIFVLFSVFMFFSCASKPSQALDQNDSLTSPENEKAAFEDEDLKEIDEPEVTDLLPEDGENQDDNSLEEWNEEDLPELEEMPENNEADSDSDSDSDKVLSEGADVENPENSEEALQQNQDESQDAEEKSENEKSSELLSAEMAGSQEEADETTSEEGSDAEDTSSTEDTDNLEDADLENETEEDGNPETSPYTVSRSVSMKVSEYLDVTYPGNGWIYMGAVDNSKNITYFGRKLGTENTNFSLQARLPGRKILHFYKNDSLTGQIIDDYIEVTVLEERGNPSTHVEAPAFLMPLKAKRPAAIKNGQKSEIENALPADSAAGTAESVQTASDSFDDEVEDVEESRQKKSRAQKKSETKAEPAALSPQALEEKSEAHVSDKNLGELLAAAQNHLVKKDYKSALSEINEYIQNSSDNRDEALFIKGQILEAKSEVQNITEAINSYTTLTKNYPASKFWDKANKRIIYLNRFYLQGR